jgi:hypothetical protein
MKDETPREPVRETPAPDHPRPSMQPRHYETRAPRVEHVEAADTGPMWKGILTALGLVAACVMADAVTIVAVLSAVDGPERGEAAVYAVLLLTLLELAAAVLVSRRLPRASRTAFWATGITSVGAAMTFLIGICGMQLGG